jgi:hypothetical protein
MRYVPALLLAFAFPVLAQGAQVDLEAYTVTHAGKVSVAALVQTEPMTPVALYASASDQPGPKALVTTTVTDALGRALILAPFDLAGWPEDLDIHLQAVTYQDGALEEAGSVVPLDGLPLCEMLDFDYTIGQQEPVPGEVVSQQWALVGMHVSALNNVAGHPDLAIVFDSGAPTGGDTDLATPGPGIGNDTAMGQLLILAENAVDADADDLIDDPDDEAGGGIVRFDFDEPYDACSITLVDVDDSGPSEVRFYTDLLLPPDVLAVPNVGDNSVQKLAFQKFGLVRIDVAFAGSGGIAEMELVPCPKLVNFDERTLGVPLDIQVGETITTQFQDLGLTIETDNAVPGHPDKAILFDSENPTGEDTDLVTPGYGIGNDTPLGKVLIIAEDDVDADMDGLVDDPDDEELGGIINFKFDNDIIFQGATILDVDGSRSDAFNLYNAADVLLGSFPIQALGDNSVQNLFLAPGVPGVRRIEVVLDGSGAVTRLRFCPQNDPE